MNIADLRSMPVDLPGYVNAKDLNSQIIWISNLWIKPLGFNRTEELIGICAHDIELFTDEMIGQYRMSDERALSGNHWFGIEETLLIDFGHINLLTSKVPIFASDNTICGVLCTDIPLIDSKSDHFIRSMKKNSEPILGKKSLLQLEITEEDNRRSLTARELEVLFYFLRGKRLKSISSILNVHHKTIEFHVANIKQKFSCHSREQLIEGAITEGYMNIIPKKIFKEINKNKRKP